LSLQLQYGKDRILFIDIARFLAMSLVFYGHFVERVMYLKNPTAAAQYKFIYSFHMVVFFILAGYVANEKDLSFNFGKFLKHRLLSRLLPFVFFTVLFMVMAAIFPGDFFHLKLPSVKGYIDGLVSTIFGIPMFCVPSWFLLIIFSVEFIHYAIFRLLKSDAKIVIGIVVFYVVGFVFNWKFDIVDLTKGRVVGWNYLFIHEAITMYAFYLIGVYMRRKRFLQENESSKIILPAALVMFLIVLFTYRLNSGLFSFPKLDAVAILLSSHGHIIWFPLTAVAGSLMILLIARAIPTPRTITWMGQNTLILMCLNGIFYHYFNPPIAEWVVGHLSGTPLVILLVSTAITAVSLSSCIPLIYLLNRWVPQLVGKPKLTGPLLKKLFS
jgi:acyltransferase